MLLMHNVYMIKNYVSSYRLYFLTQEVLSPKSCPPIGLRGPLSPAHLAPRPLSVNLGPQSEAKDDRRPRDRRTSFRRTDRPLPPLASC